MIERFQLRADKRLGQHFLLDRQLLARIVRTAGDLRGRTVLEVGPGPGGLTRALLDADAGRVIAIERDPRCVAALAELAAAPGRLEVIEADALRFDVARLGADHLVAMANLPYNIGTPLLLLWLDRIELFDVMVLMFQREVAERLAASPGSAAYGRLSVIVQWLCEVAAAFGQRRKMLRVSLRSLIANPLVLLEAAGVPPTARAEEIDVAGFCRLARSYAALDGGRPGQPPVRN